MSANRDRVNLMALAVVAAGVLLPGLGRHPSLFDEAYYYPDCERYRSGIFFMQGHPPLGKFFLFAGEAWNRANAAQDLSGLWDKVFYSGAPEKLVAGQEPRIDRGLYRLPSALAGIACVLVFYGILRAAAWPGLAFSGALLLVLCNACAVQHRAGLLDAFLHLYVLGSVHLALVTPRRRIGPLSYGVLGVLAGAAFMVKASGLCAMALGAWLIWRERGALLAGAPWRWLERLAVRGAFQAAGCALVVAAVWYVHCGVARRPQGGWWGASPAYRKVIEERQTWNPVHLPMMVREQAGYGLLQHVTTGSNHPAATLPQGASRPVEWFWGARPIPYRWESHLLYTGVWLWPNPVVWRAGNLLFALALAGMVWTALQPATGPRRAARAWLRLGIPCAALWGAYMLPMMALSRPLYLYHYLLPLWLAWGAAVAGLAALTPTWGRKALGTAMAVLVALAAASFLFHAPLTYGIPMDPNAFLARIWSEFYGIALP